MKLTDRCLCISLSLLSGTLIEVRDIAQAQIVQDTTLSQPSVVNAAANTIVIDGGTQRGTNLFHSFREFSVPAGCTAFFNNAADVQNILARVTGGSISRIDGQIRANGSANLFLLNPNGILFGANASLNIGGSFVATTANSIRFSHQVEFGARNPQEPPLLTVSAPVGLQFGNDPRGIVDRSTVPIVNAIGQPFLEDGNELTGGLQVRPGRTLALVGGNLRIPGGYLFTAGGRIELGSVAGSGQVRLTAIPDGWRFGYEQIQNFGNIQISRGSEVATTGYLDLNPLGAGGAIHIQGEQVQLTQGSVIYSATQGAGRGQPLLIEAPIVTLTGGFPDPNHPQEPFLSDIETVADIGATGTAGSVTVLARQLNVLNGAHLGSETFDAGRAGTVRIRADQVEVRGGSPIQGVKPASSLILSQALEGATRSAQTGALIIETDRLRVLAGGQINVTTFGAGRAGNLTVRANDIQLDGLLLDANGNPQRLANGFFFPGGLFAGTEENSIGQGGQLRVETQRLQIANGAVLQTTTLGRGNAGNLIVHATDSIQVSGLSISADRPFGIQAFSGAGVSGDFPRATGRGGDIDIRTRALRVQNQGTIAANSINRQATARGAGNIIIQAQTFQLDHQSSLAARTASGNGGNISLQNVSLVSLRHNSQISTSAGQRRASGSGGDIAIDASNGFVTAQVFENSDISANSFQGSGGNISIQAQSILGLQPRSRQAIEQSTSDLSQFDPQDLPTSDITTISQTVPTLDGKVTITTPDIDPSRGLVELPSNVVDPSQQIAQGCAPRGDRTSQFVSTGRGGLPLSPDEPLRGQTAINPAWVTLDSEPRDGTVERLGREHAIAPENAIVEANELSRDATGKTILIARSHPIAPLGSGILQNQCDRP